MCEMNNNKSEKVSDETDDHDEEFDSDDDEEEEMDENVGKVINVAFDARPPSSVDFHGIKGLLQQLFLKDVNEDLSELADHIINQDYVGSVLKQDFGDSDEDSDEDEEDAEEERENIFAICTAINLCDNQSKSCIENVNAYLSSKCEQHYKTEPSRMSKILSDPSKQIGLLINERFINIPPQITLPSFESLKADLEKAVRKKRKFDFTHFILISKTYRAKALPSEIFYTNSEEQLFQESCDFHFTFSVAHQRDAMADGQWDEEEEMEALRTVMVFDAGALPSLIDKLKHELAQA